MAAPDSKVRLSSLEDNELIRDISFRYIPLAGAASSLIFSTNVMNPRLFRRLLAPSDHIIANCLWFNAHLGVGLYLFGSKHLKRAPMYHRVMYSVFGAMVFNFGSVLFWATTKALLPQNNSLRCLFGLGSGIVLFAVGREYLNFVDSQVGNTLK